MVDIGFNITNLIEYNPDFSFRFLTRIDYGALNKLIICIVTLFDSEHETPPDWCVCFDFYAD